MSAVADHLGALILDAVRKKGGNYSAFSEEIPVLLRETFGIDVSVDSSDEALEYLRFVGGVEILSSELAGNLLRFRVQDALFLYTDEAVEPSDSTSREYDERYTLAQDQRVLKSYYHGNDAWVDRVVARLKSGDYAGIMGVADEMLSVSVPASDRIVKLTDNQINEIDRSIEEVISGISQENSIDGDHDLRSRFLGQLAATRELIQAGSVRAFLIYETAIRILGVLIHRYQGHVIGETAKKLLDLLIESVLKK